MCGICGVIGESVDQKKIQDMMESMGHRGPDDRGVYQKNEIFFGHCRLSIIDVTSLGHQPMAYKEFILIYNGEIYNYIEIKKELQEEGHTFFTDTDTEVVLHAYEEWGKRCFEKFRGMWALALYDKKENKVVLSRDRFGIKPLYYYEDNKSFVFASEIHAILKSGIVPAPDMETVLRYVVIGVDNNNKDTFFRGIKQLQGGKCLIYSVKDAMMTFFDFFKIDYDYRKEYDSKEYEREYLKAVELHLRSDVKVGACLSGGLDSSSLAAVSAEFLRLSQKQLEAITATSEDVLNDETHYAKEVATHCGLKWITVQPTYEDFCQHHLHCLHIQGEPVASSSVFMQYWVMKRANSLNIKVMLDGQGGDETLLGYERYYAVYLYQLLKKGMICKCIKSYFEIVHSSKLNFGQLLLYFVYFLLPFVRKNILGSRVPFIKKNLLNETLVKNESWLTSKKNLTKMQIDELTSTQLPHLLRYEDRNSMAFSIEARVPYVDHLLVEKAMHLKVKEKINQGYTKYCLRKIAEKYLPASIAWRKNKRGFESPEKIWLNKHAEVMQSVVEQSALIKNIVDKMPTLKMLPLRLQWRLYNLAIWEKQFLSEEKGKKCIKSVI